MYEYLAGCAIMAAVWLAGFIARKDMRKPMIWSGLAFIAVMTIAFVMLRTLSAVTYIGGLIVPDYWNPHTLFNLGQITGGYAIEDAAFMFFAGGIASLIYETAFRKKIVEKRKHRHHIRALVIALACAGAFAITFKINLIYALTVFFIAGAAGMVFERKDLIEHSLYGGTLFLGLYFVSFLAFNAFFPMFIQEAYQLKNITGILILGVPLEELLFAMSFGLLWAPLYEYEHGSKVKEAT